MDPNRQYRQDELSSDIFNSGNGDIKNYNGRAVKVGVNGNGTRSLSDMGDWNSYTNNKAITDANNQKNTQFNTMVDQGRNDVTGFLTKYQTAVPNIVTSTQNKYGIPDQLSATNALNSRIQDLKTNFSNSGAGGYASGQQVDAALNSRYLPQYTTAMTNLNNSAQLAQTEEQQLTKPYETEGQMINDRLAREMTGFTAEQQNELQGLIAKLQAGTQLTTTEMNNANALAVAQKSYDAALKSQQIQNQYQTVQPGSTLTNTFTGQVINPGILTGNQGYYKP